MVAGGDPSSSSARVVVLDKKPGDSLMAGRWGQDGVDGVDGTYTALDIVNRQVVMENGGCALRDEAGEGQVGGAGDGMLCWFGRRCLRWKLLNGEDGRRGKQDTEAE